MFFFFIVIVFTSTNVMPFFDIKNNKHKKNIFFRKNLHSQKKAVPLKKIIKT